MPRHPKDGLGLYLRDHERRLQALTPGLTGGITPLGTLLPSGRGAPGTLSTTPVTPARHPFYVTRPYLHAGAWKVSIQPGSLNAIIPVVGDVTSTGGSLLTTSTRLTLTTGEPYIALGVKTNLETRAITRLTIQTVEDLISTTDIEDRIRIAYIPIALLTEIPSPPSWTKAIQIATTNLSYFTAGSTDLVWRA